MLESDHQAWWSVHVPPYNGFGSVEKSRRRSDASRANARCRLLVLADASNNFGALCDRIKTPLTAFDVFTLAGATPPHSIGTTQFRSGCLPAQQDTARHMVIYRITERDARFIVGTDREAILICRSLEIAHQAVADAELLETLTSKQIFERRVAVSQEERLSLPREGMGRVAHRERKGTMRPDGSLKTE